MGFLVKGDKYPSSDIFSALCPPCVPTMCTNSQVQSGVWGKRTDRSTPTSQGRRLGSHVLTCPLLRPLVDRRICKVQTPKPSVPSPRAVGFLCCPGASVLWSEGPPTRPCPDLPEWAVKQILSALDLRPPNKRPLAGRFRAI